MIFSLLALLGCSNPGEGPEPGADPCQPGEDADILLGIGEFAFEALSEDAQVELVHGPQGGYHVALALEARFLDPSTTWSVSLLGEVDGEILGETYPYLAMRCNTGEGALQGWGALLIFDAQPEDLHEKWVDVSAEVIDASGTTLATETSLFIVDPWLE